MEIWLVVVESEAFGSEEEAIARAKEEVQYHSAETMVYVARATRVVYEEEPRVRVDSLDA